VPLTDPVPRPPPPKDQLQHSPPVPAAGHPPCPEVPGRSRVGEITPSQDTPRRHWVPSDGRVPAMGGCPVRAPSLAPGTHPSLRWEESGSWSVHELGCCFSTAGRSNTSLKSIFLLVTITLEALFQKLDLLHHPNDFCSEKSKPSDSCKAQT